MAEASQKVAFQLEAGVNRAEVNVQERDETIVLSSEASKPYTTSEQSVIEALDAAEGVKRADSPKAPEK
jgi:hypothetical protein